MQFINWACTHLLELDLSSQRIIRRAAWPIMSCKDLIKKTSKGCNYSILLLIKKPSIAHSSERERQKTKREREKERGITVALCFSKLMKNDKNLGLELSSLFALQTHNANKMEKSG
ncbi:hypothetical protein DPX16_10835 [Anabarilius grahami]|uniref:Uncharacterized protein n=1 Tax=Anabarilius grahami TaxID=495550 RepID=A0A3N0Z7W6_ANAGA|nr:hypothetical protein DPX16_10835 [Anabarilius grahami]